MVAITHPKSDRYQRYSDDFIEYHRLNPHVYDMVKDLAYKAYWSGQKRTSMKRIFEVIRWETDLKTIGKFKLNNTYTADYARLVMDKNEWAVGLFETRKSPGKITLPITSSWFETN